MDSANERPCANGDKEFRDSEGPSSPCLRVSFSGGLTGLFYLPGCHYGKHGMDQGGEQGYMGGEQTSAQRLGREECDRELVEGG